MCVLGQPYRESRGERNTFVVTRDGGGRASLIVARPEEGRGKRPH